LSASLSRAEGPDERNAPKNNAGNTASNRVGNVAPLQRADPNDNLDFWLNQAETVNEEDFQPASEPAKRTRGPRRPDALPGVVELSNGQQLPGLLYTTRGRDWELYDTEDRTWHRIPPITVSSMTAVVDEEEIELEWRWKAMGVDERVYTGNSYPMRRLSWKVKLIDGTTFHGAIKGQPIFIDLAGSVTGPLTLHEKQKGEFGDTLDDLVYVKQIVVSKRMMDAVAKDQLNRGPTAPATKPAAKPAAK